MWFSSISTSRKDPKMVDVLLANAQLFQLSTMSCKEYIRYKLMLWIARLDLIDCDSPHDMTLGKLRWSNESNGVYATSHHKMVSSFEFWQNTHTPPPTKLTSMQKVKVNYYLHFNGIFQTLMWPQLYGGSGKNVHGCLAHYNWSAWLVMLMHK